MSSLPPSAPPPDADPTARRRSPRDEQTGLARILDGLDGIVAHVERTDAAIAALGSRLDAIDDHLTAMDGRLGSLDAALDRPVSAVVDLDAMRTAVAAAFADAEVPSTADHVQALVTTALSVLPAPVVDADAVRSAVAGLAVPAADLGPVLAAIEATELPAPDLGPVLAAISAAAVDADALRSAIVAALDEHLAAAPPAAPTVEFAPPLDVDALAEALARRVGDDLALTTGGALGKQEIVVDLVRRTVAASHRAMVSQLSTLLDGMRHELGEQQAAMVADVSMDVEAIRRVIERAAGPARQATPEEL